MALLAKYSSDKKIQWALLSALIVSLIISIGALVTLQSILRSDEFIIEDDFEDALRFVTMKADAEASVSSYRGFLITGKHAFLERFQEADAHFESHLDSLISTARGNKEFQELMHLKKTQEEHRVHIKKSIRMKNLNKSSSEIEKYFDEQIMPQRRSTLLLIDTLQKQKDEELKFIKQEVANRSKRVFWIILGMTGFSLCLVIFGAIVLTRKLTSIHTLSEKSAAELKVTVESLQKVNSNLGQFAATAAHDLKSPLRTVSTYVQLLSSELKNGKSANVEDVMRSIMESTKRMRTLVDDLLGYFTAENTELRPEPTPLGEIVDYVVENLHADIKENNATVEYQNLPTILAEPKSLAGLLQNLISNAIKYRGNASPSIKISAEEEEKNWKISVEDNGIGFSMDRREEIFRPFKRLVQNQDVTGTGLGLAICKKIVDKHKGKIWATSTPGKGSTFVFQIPKLSTT